MRLATITATVLSLFTASALQAQNNASPYSIAGIGDIESGYFDRSSGMANTGVSLSSGRFMYQSNPASLAALDDYYFSAELTGRFKEVRYSGKAITDINTKSNDLQMKRLSLGIKLQKWWGLGFGLMPYSTSNYSFYSKKDIEGSGDFSDAYYEGDGGVNQAYITNAFRPFKNFAIGIQSSFLFGSLSQKETLDYTSSTPIVTTRDIYLHKFYFKGGIQYKIPITKKWKLAVGATASNKTQLPADYTLNVTEGTTKLITDKSIKESYFKLPVIYTVGGSLNYNDKFTFAFDYQQQNWSELNYKGLNYALVNSNRVSGGFEYSKKLSYSNQLFERWYIQGGGFYSNSYLRIKGEQLSESGFTVGAGFTPKRSPQLALQFNLEFGKRGTTNLNLIKENYTQASVTFVYRDFWFTKGRKYD